MMVSQHRNSEIAPLDLAGFFLKSSVEKGMTNLKLNKLIYLAHGYYWGNFESPLITNGELAEAWKHGPVFRSVYNTFGGFKADIIPAAYAAVSTKLDSSNETISVFMNHLWDTFKNAPPWYLVRMLHEKDGPWYIVWHREGGRHTLGRTIPDHLTKAYYIAKVRELREGNGSQ